MVEKTHVCGDPNSPCDMDCMEGYDGIAHDMLLLQEVDLLLADVRELVDLVKELVEQSGDRFKPDCNCIHCRAEKIIASVEARLK